MTQLAEAGRVRLDEPVRRHLPEFTLADAGDADRITVRELLQQTSGLADRGFGAVNDTGVRNLRQRLVQLRAARTVSAPGREFHYFDPNYQILARMVEVVTGQRFADYMRDHVFGPVGMRDTVTVNTGADGPSAAPRLASGHIVMFGVPVAAPPIDGFLGGSGRVISTARDMARWLVVQNQGGRIDGRTLLDPADVRLMHTPASSVDGDGYGMGWLVSRSGDLPEEVRHDGVLDRWYAEQVLLPGSGYGIALLYDGTYAMAPTSGIRDGVVALLTGHHPPGTVTVTGLAVAAARGTALVRLHRATPTSGPEPDREEPPYGADDPA